MLRLDDWFSCVWASSEWLSGSSTLNGDKLALNMSLFLFAFSFFWLFLPVKVGTTNFLDPLLSLLESFAALLKLLFSETLEDLAAASCFAFTIGSTPSDAFSRFFNADSYSRFSSSKPYSKSWFGFSINRKLLGVANNVSGCLSSVALFCKGRVVTFWKPGVSFPCLKNCLSDFS